MLIYLKTLLKKTCPNFLLIFVQSLRLPLKPKLNKKLLESIFDNKEGIEIGGPSDNFRYVLPIYEYIETLDVLNFSNETIWEGQINEGEKIELYKNKYAAQIIGETTNLDKINSDSYDFVISNNCLEHSANPLKGLEEWKRMTRNNGHILLVLPKKESNFDWKRPFTPFEVILEKYNNDIGEDDLSSLEEILKYHDLSKDPLAGNLSDFKERSLNNFKNRGLHHHVFNLSSMDEMFNFFGIDVLFKSENKIDYFIIGKVNK